MVVAYGLLAYSNESVGSHLVRDDGQIPEAGNGIPDLLDEVMYELKWLQGMQDPTDAVECVPEPAPARPSLIARAPQPRAHMRTRALDIQPPSKSIH